MIRYLTSDFKNCEKINNGRYVKPIDNTNGFVDSLKESLKGNKKIVFVVSDGYQEHEKNMIYVNIFFESLKLVGIQFDNYYVLEDSTRDKASEYISDADLVFLCGGRTAYQMKFFEEINLKKLLELYDGIVIGQSAGAINMAKLVYNSPEDIDNPDPIIYEGLGLTSINIEPHFELDDSNFDEVEKFQRSNIIEESYKRKIFGQCNGSYIKIDNNDYITISGETYIIENGSINLICKNREKIEINFNKITK